ncbi:hypothetical protein EVAR_99292_1 [Eumeta japonica]|uniref:Uncharacterized protein n=1 Tax=Eumeta variegata TaxID=151549 RepID=A0A4C2A2J4_EUMVA|nr:hypothetical protein EVAR_99292_1 [Eumeta japonica]
MQFSTTVILQRTNHMIQTSAALTTVGPPTADGSRSRAPNSDARYVNWRSFRVFTPATVCTPSLRPVPAPRWAAAKDSRHRLDDDRRYVLSLAIIWDRRYNVLPRHEDRAIINGDFIRKPSSASLAGYPSLRGSESGATVRAGLRPRRAPRGRGPRSRNSRRHRMKMRFIQKQTGYIDEIVKSCRKALINSKHEAKIESEAGNGSTSLRTNTTSIYQQNFKITRFLSDYVNNTERDEKITSEIPESDPPDPKK